MRRFVLILLTLGLAASARAELLVSAAASLSDVLKTVAARYQAEGGGKVTFNFAASGLLARQIEEGAPADIFISADERQMAQLQARGEIESATRIDLLTNQLVVVARPGVAEELRTLGDLTKANRISIGDPATVPAGAYAKDVLVRAKLWEAVRAKIVPAENVRAALAIVEAGNADAGLVYETDARRSQSLRVAFRIAASEAPRIIYVAAVVRGSSHAEGAIKFLRYLKSPEASDIFRAAGFGVTP